MDSMNSDHCRIGSLEMYKLVTAIFAFDHCRIGSLEKQYINIKKSKTLITAA